MKPMRGNERSDNAVIQGLIGRIGLPLPALLAVFSAAMLGGALAFQYLGGMAPCVLCLYQRYPHAAVIGLGALALLLARSKPDASRVLMAISGLTLLGGAGIAGFHVGVEQLWWEGTSECGSTGTPDNLEALKAQIMAAPVTRCTDIPWQLFGISMAGYNFLLSAAAGLLAILAARPKPAS